MKQDQLYIEKTYKGVADKYIRKTVNCRAGAWYNYFVLSGLDNGKLENEIDGLDLQLDPHSRLNSSIVYAFAMETFLNKTIN